MTQKRSVQKRAYLSSATMAPKPDSASRPLKSDEPLPLMKSTSEAPSIRTHCPTATAAAATRPVAATQARISLRRTNMSTRKTSSAAAASTMPGRITVMVLFGI